MYRSNTSSLVYPEKAASNSKSYCVFTILQLSFLCATESVGSLFREAVIWVSDVFVANSFIPLTLTHAMTWPTFHHQSQRNSQIFHFSLP